MDLSLLVKHHVRLVTSNDIPWLHYIGRKKYGQHYDEETVFRWVTEVVLKNPLMFYGVRTDDAFVCAYINTYPWYPGEMECNIAFIAADDGAHWQAVALLRSTIEWARKRNCKAWQLGADTDVDLGAMARLLGAKTISPRYKLELR